jgi:hypothetical protein
VFSNRRATCLTFANARVALGYYQMVSSKFVWSDSKGLGYHEEPRNGPKIKLHIMKVNLGFSCSFGR